MVSALDNGNYRIIFLKTHIKTEYIVEYEDFTNSNPTWVNSKLLKKISDKRLYKIKEFMIKFDSLSPFNRLSYLKNIKSDGIFSLQFFK